MNPHKKEQLEHIFANMKEYMFTSENILRFTQSTVLDTPPKSTHQKQKIIKPNLPVSIYYPHQKDELFWCFFIAFKGMNDYEINKNHSFTYEKEFKIASVEKLREKKDLLKPVKIKKNHVEDELVNKKKISLTTLQALCIIYEMSIIYVWGKKFCDFRYGDIPTCMIITDDYGKKIGLKENINETDIKNIREKYWYVENPLKPLRCISSYTIKELHQICEKLELKIIDISGKKLNKKTLYENIGQKI